MAKRLRTDSHITDPSQLEPSDERLRSPNKITVPDPAEESQIQPMRCSLPPHIDTIAFPSYDEYEAHYLKHHVNRCSECGKNFPTQHLLNIHIEENHDPLILARRDRGEKTFSCFVEGCERKCSTAQKRRRHMIDKHMFPRNYNFFIVNDGIDKHNSLLRSSNHGHHRRLSLPQSPLEGRLRNRKTSVSSPALNEGVNHLQQPDTDEIDVLTSSLSALQFVPTSVIKKLGSDRKQARGGK